jgi:hypothetical protein
VYAEPPRKRRVSDIPFNRTTEVDSTVHLPKWAVLCRVGDGHGEVKTSGRLDDEG